MYLDFIPRTTQPQPPTSPAIVPRRVSYWSRAPTPGTRRPSTRPRWASRAAATPATARCRGAWETSAMGCRHGEVWAVSELLGMTKCFTEFMPGVAKIAAQWNTGFLSMNLVNFSQDWTAPAWFFRVCDSKKEVFNNSIYTFGCSRRQVKVNISKNHCNAQLAEVQFALSFREKG